MLRAAVYHAEQPQNAVWQALYLADLARKSGRLALQNVTEELRDAPFLHRAISMVVDGLPADEVERMLSRDAEAARSEEHTSELQPLMRLSYAVDGLQKNKNHNSLQYRK